MGNRQGKAKKAVRTVISWILIIGYLIVLSYFLFFSEYYGRTEWYSEYRYNLKPFAEIRRFYVYRHTLGLQTVTVNLLGNVLAFVPLGFIFPTLSKKNARFFRILIYSALISALIESLQLIYHVGIFDVDDIILNTCGALLGYLLFLMFRHKEKER